MKHVPFDVLGNVALVKFKRGTGAKEKKMFASKLLKQKQIKTVLEKTGKFKGRLRKQTTKYIAGEKTKEALYKENGCVFRFNVDSAYFSPRLASERDEIARKVKKGDKVLVMFAGVSPYSIVIAKNSRSSVVFSNEVNKEANKYAQLNIELNKLKGKVVLLPGDIKRISKRFKEKMDVIVMPRPQLKDTFLREAFALSKSGTRVFYYDFCKEEEIPGILAKIKEEAQKAKKKIKILKTKRAGEIAPYKFRIRVDFVVG